MKSTPKSCSCRMCRRLRGTPAAGQLMKLEERAFRHQQAQALRRDPESVAVAPAGVRKYAA